MPCASFFIVSAGTQLAFEYRRITHFLDGECPPRAEMPLTVCGSTESRPPVSFLYGEKYRKKNLHTALFPCKLEYFVYYG